MQLPNNVELLFRKAVLYSNGKRNTDKLKVRILPDQIGYDAEDLPLLPMFNCTELIHGASEEDTKDLNSATQLWVLVTDDLKNGFVFSEAQATSDVDASKMLTIWPFNAFHTHVSRMGMNTNSFMYDELKVIYTNSPYYTKYQSGGIKSKNGVKTAGCIDVTNVRTGERWWMLSSGTCIAMMLDGIHLRAGSPDKDHSTIDMTPTQVYIKAKNVVLDGEHTSLGRHGMNACAMQGPVPVAVDGQAICPLYDVTF